MPEYRIYLLDHDGRIARSFALEVGDDPTALEKAEAIREADTVEIWDRARLVARLGTPGHPPKRMS